MQLSRELARRGHEVTHAYATSIQTPRGALSPQGGDPASFRIEGISISAPFQKQNFLKRRFQELEYGRLLATRVEEIRPDWLISANTPTEPQAILLKRCRKLGVRFASWVQDFYGVAVHRLCRNSVPVLGSLVGRYYMRLDSRVLRQSDRIILITEDFRRFIDEMEIDPDRVHVIENWAPLDELPLRPRTNSWSEKHDLSDKFVFLYSGTLGMKHNPLLLLKLTQAFRDDETVRVVVISEGLGADWLREKKAELGLTNLLLLPYQPFGDMPDVLASSEVLVAVLEPGAGVFSVPSKVLTYLCAGKPLLAAIPPENLAARIIARSHSGLVVSPNETDAFVGAGDSLLSLSAERRKMGSNARAYALETFDIGRITDAFEAIGLLFAAESVRAPRRPTAVGSLSSSLWSQFDRDSPRASSR